LAAHLEVPLPYLLYRAQTRYEEDLRGLQDIRGALSPTSAHAMTKTSEDTPSELKRPSSTRRPSSLLAGSTSRLSTSTLLASPIGVRARLNSLGGSPRPKKVMTSSVLTLQGPRKTHVPLSPTSPSSSERESDSSDEQATKEEEADRHLEEQEALDKKLKDLQRMMTNDALGLVSTSRPKGKGKQVDRGRVDISPTSAGYRADELSSRSQSVSSASSPQGSIPSIPSPPPDAHHQTPIGRHFSPGKSTSPPAVSPRSALGQSHLRYGGMARTASVGASDQGSNHGSSASSFSDISGPYCLTRFLRFIHVTVVQRRAFQHLLWKALFSQTFVVLVHDCEWGFPC
jgi:hypothetical protein